HTSQTIPISFTFISYKYNLKPRVFHVFEVGVPGLISALQDGMTVTDVRNIEVD
ncbi:haloacid dehalogenase, partial [Francisella tularensis subsp. holarctica]|nr:haloacid dehalogenase [Francisella tularensis subsp. holarctica]